MMWLPASTFGTSVPYKRDSTQHYSIFAKWNFEQIPGMGSPIEKLKESANQLENVDDELSPSVEIEIFSYEIIIWRNCSATAIC